MVQAIPQSPDSWTQPYTPPALFDPMLIRASRQIYRTYRTVHPRRVQQPLGVVMHRYSYRGHLIFKQYPALLPDECFIPFEQIESELS